MGSEMCIRDSSAVRCRPIDCISPSTACSKVGIHMPSFASMEAWERMNVVSKKRGVNRLIMGFDFVLRG